MFLTSVEVEVLQDRNCTVAEVTMPVWVHLPEDESYQVETHYTGSSKRENGEPFDKTVGQCFAMSRAFRALADDLEKTGWDQLRMVEAKFPPQVLPPLLSPKGLTPVEFDSLKLQQKFANEQKEVKESVISKQVASKMERRNKTICGLYWDKGWTGKRIAAKYGLTPTRVYQIVNK